MDPFLLWWKDTIVFAQWPDCGRRERCGQGDGNIMMLIYKMFVLTVGLYPEIEGFPCGLTLIYSYNNMTSTCDYDYCKYLIIGNHIIGYHIYSCLLSISNHAEDSSQLKLARIIY